MSDTTHTAPHLRRHKSSLTDLLITTSRKELLVGIALFMWLYVFRFNRKTCEGKY
jgi:hypothetical protein